ncbi:GNAT family acetyltransferase [Marisediminicola sp. LYQ134]|uniref:GNAT family acetyltransferase n=1 Tax=unclassified Marisediminicola TaxID=2618316 RepID=UPI0039831BEF
MIIRSYRTDDTEAVVALWRETDLTRPWNDPYRDIERSVAERPELFLVGSHNGAVVATAMGGYDGHRGWVYYFAVSPAHRGSGFGRRMMAELERRLTALGCPKLNLLVRADNPDAVGFYEAIGYSPDDSVSLGRRLIEE